MQGGQRKKDLRRSFDNCSTSRSIAWSSHRASPTSLKGTASITISKGCTSPLGALANTSSSGLRPREVEGPSLTDKIRRTGCPCPYVYNCPALGDLPLSPPLFQDSAGYELKAWSARLLQGTVGWKSLAHPLTTPLKIRQHL